MNLTQYLLGKLAEEATEVAQMALKCQKFGLSDEFEGKVNSERLRGELDDLNAILELLSRHKRFNYIPPPCQNSAHKKVLKWAQYSADIGLLNRISVQNLKIIVKGES